MKSTFERKTLTIKIPVWAVFDKCPRAKVNEFQVHCLEINQQVFVFQIPMYHPFAVTRNDGLHHLTEEVASQLFLQPPFLGDEVKKILAGFRPLHDNDERVVAFKTVEEFDHPRDSANLSQEANL